LSLTRPSHRAGELEERKLAVEINMPHMGVSVTEGTVTAWHKAPGDQVAVDDAVCDVATDKVDTEVVATEAGVLERILVDAGETVAVGAALAVLNVAGGDPAAAAAPAATGGSSTSVTAGDAPVRPPSVDRTPRSPAAPAVVGAAPFDHAVALDRVARNGGRHALPLASPVARRVAEAHGLDLAALEGTGLAGRIRKSDVLAAIERAAIAPAVGLPLGYDDVPHEIVETTRIRRVTAEHMIRSRQTAAHMTTEVDVDMQRVSAVRAEINALRTSAGLTKLSYLPFITRAAVASLRTHPDLNATFEVERNVRWRQVNVGIAVDTPHGLLVPVIRRCETLTVDAIGDRLTDLAERARTRRLDADDLRAGTFTITNPGSVGAASAPAIINQPQVAILGVPKIARKPWVVALPDGQETIAIRPILRLALTFDHRAVDGAAATRCVVQIGTHLESWALQDYR
jgi:pyruvate/2-oxoglutarate dehydrogenase complex dihydrolipoamide acyltransferase (E2) component